MKILITELTDNFLPADTEICEGLNLNASVDAYCAIVNRVIESTNPDFEVDFDIQSDTCGYCREPMVLWDTCDVDMQEEEDILLTVNAIRERVFNQQEFWVYEG